MSGLNIPSKATDLRESILRGLDYQPTPAAGPFSVAANGTAAYAWDPSTGTWKASVPAGTTNNLQISCQRHLSNGMLIGDTDFMSNQFRVIQSQTMDNAFDNARDFITFGFGIHSGIFHGITTVAASPNWWIKSHDGVATTTHDTGIAVLGGAAKNILELDIAGDRLTARINGADGGSVAMAGSIRTLLQLFHWYVGRFTNGGITVANKWGDFVIVCKKVT